MAFDVNSCTFIGRFTRDPELKVFNNSKVARFALAFTGERRKNPQTQEWEDSPCFIECEAWQFERGLKTADVIDKYCRKGSKVYVRGHLKLERWEDKNGGGSRQAIKLVVDEFVSLDSKSESGGGSGGGYGGGSYGGGKKPAEDQGGGDAGYGSEYGDNDPIPF